MLQEHQLGKREMDFEVEGRHTEGVWGPGKRKRGLQPPQTMRVLWTLRPTGTSLMVPYMNKKRTELGAWGRLSKRSSDSGSHWNPLTPSDPRIRIIRSSLESDPMERIIKRSADETGPHISLDPRIRIQRRNLESGPWERIIKREADESGPSSAGGLIRIMRGSKDLDQLERASTKRRAMWPKRKNNKVAGAYGRLSKKLEPGKNLVKWGRINKKNMAGDEEFEQNEEEYADEAEILEEEFSNENYENLIY